MKKVTIEIIIDTDKDITFAVSKYDNAYVFPAETSAVLTIDDKSICDEGLKEINCKIENID
jgi:hypothetical protein